MVTYNPKDWIKLIFRFHKSDTIRILFPAMLLLAIFTAGVAYLVEHHVIHDIPSLTIFHQISGFIISLVLVFRINTAYDRWWEGRKLWGSLLNNSRNAAIKLNAIIPKHDRELRKLFSELISNYAFALKEHLRNNRTTKHIAFSDVLRESEFTASNHTPNLIATKLMSLTYDFSRKIPAGTQELFVLSTNINDLTDICGGCERIKNTPIPYSYSLFIKKFIFLYIITMPLSFALAIGYWAMLVVMVMFYAFASLELLSEEIEDPFGVDHNDLPTDEIAAKVKMNVDEILLNDAS